MGARASTSALIADTKVLYMAMHFAEGANNLTNTALDPLSKMPELKHCAVAVEKIPEAK
jgi:formate dehydrogenase major subunit